MYAGLEKMSQSGDNLAAQHIKALDELHQLIPDTYSFALYSPTSTPGDYEIRTNFNKGDPVPKYKLFTDVTGYLGNLSEAILNLDKMINQQGLKIAGQPVSPEKEVKDGLKATKENLENILGKQQSEINNNPYVISALDYYIKALKE